MNVVSLVLPSKYVWKRTAVVTLVAAAISISVSTGIRILIGAEADTVTIAVRLVLPFVIAIPLGLVWFTKLEALDRSYRDLLKQTNQLAKTASADPLTGFLNRRSFIEQFEVAQTHGVTGSFLIADVDYLKAINDRFGHLTGDDAIIATGEALASVLGGESLIARIGGDEFCAFVPQGVQDIDELSVRINEVATREFRQRSGLADYYLAVSLGTQTCKPGMTFRDLIAQSDTSLYRIKRHRGQPLHQSGRRLDGGRIRTAV